MQQLTMLVTTDGQSVLPDSEAFRAALGDPDPDYDAVGFAVRNLGFVKFQVLDRLVTEIELHPRNVELPALLAVEQLVDEVGTNLFHRESSGAGPCLTVNASGSRRLFSGTMFGKLATTGVLRGDKEEAAFAERRGSLRKKVTPSLKRSLESRQYFIDCNDIPLCEPALNHQFRYCRWWSPRKQIFTLAALTSLWRG